MEAHERVAGPQDAVAVPVEVLAVLLQHSLVPVARGPAIIRGAVRLVVCGSDVCACEAWGLAISWVDMDAMDIEGAHLGS